MAIADENLKRWRLPLLLLLGTFVGVIIFAAAHKQSTDEPRNAGTPAAQLPSSLSENRVTLSAAETANKTYKANAALQKPGPPDPVSEKTAAESAARAADAAARLAASVASPTQ
jgi:hypothetical protein